MNFTEEARKLLNKHDDNVYRSGGFFQDVTAALQSAYERGEQSGREKERESVRSAINEHPRDLSGWQYDLLQKIYDEAKP